MEISQVDPREPFNRPAPNLLPLCRYSQPRSQFLYPEHSKQVRPPPDLPHPALKPPFIRLTTNLLLLLLLLTSPPPSDGRKRTPKWIKKAGLVDDSEDRRRAARSQWAKRYDERLPNSTLDDADLAEGEEGGNYVPSRTIDEEEVARRRREGLWTNEEEEYYNEGERVAMLSSASTH